jgi:hypothetical protein
MMLNPNNFSYLNPTSFEYLYLYPIFCSILAGIIFWYVFSYLPERSRKKSFGVGVLNDLFALNNQVFSLFDFYMRHQDHTPSFFQDKIHASTLSNDDISNALQNKVISKHYLNQIQNPNHFLIIGDEVIKKVDEIDIVINRLYSFNYYLSPNEVSLLRGIHEKIHRYLPYIQLNLNGVEHLPLNPSISFMTTSLIELQDDFREFRRLIFHNNLSERNFVIHKILWLFNSEKYKDCVKECNNWTKKFPSDSNLFNVFLIRSLLFLNNKKKAYQLLDNFLMNDIDLISYRTSFYTLIIDPIIYDKVSKKCGVESILKMKQLVESENLLMAQSIINNNEIKEQFSAK